ncbi:MAG: transporter [Planctomycetota bacterium]|nr:transporter [Planctomycetota bacterium]
MKRRLTGLFFACAALAFEWTPSFAGEGNGGDGDGGGAEGNSRPAPQKLATEDAECLGKGGWEIELGYEFATARRVFDADGSAEPRRSMRTHDASLSVKYGVLDRLDLGLVFGYGEIRDREEEPSAGRGLTDPEFNLKVNILKDGERDLFVSFLSAATVPAGRWAESDSLAISNEFVTCDNRVVVTKHFGERWTATFDAGYTLPIGGRRKEYRGTFSANVAVGFQAWDMVQPEIELNFSSDFFRGTTDQAALAVTAGFIVPLRENVVLKMGAQQTVAGWKSDMSTVGILGIIFGF